MVAGYENIEAKTLQVFKKGVLRWIEENFFEILITIKHIYYAHLSCFMTSLDHLLTVQAYPFNEFFYEFWVVFLPDQGLEFIADGLLELVKLVFRLREHAVDATAGDL